MWWKWREVAAKYTNKLYVYIVRGCDRIRMSKSKLIYVESISASFRWVISSSVAHHPGLYNICIPRTYYTIFLFVAVHSFFSLYDIFFFSLSLSSRQLRENVLNLINGTRDERKKWRKRIRNTYGYKRIRYSSWGEQQQQPKIQIKFTNSK